MPHLGDVGTAFDVTIVDEDTAEAVDVSEAIVKQIIFRKPGGIKLTKDAEFVTDGTDGKIRYTAIDDDLDKIGVWNIQGYVQLEGGEWSSEIQQFTVYRNL